MESQPGNDSLFNISNFLWINKYSSKNEHQKNDFFSDRPSLTGHFPLHRRTMKLQQAVDHPLCAARHFLKRLAKGGRPPYRLILQLCSLKVLQTLTH